MKINNKAFSLLEIGIVILIISLIVASITAGRYLLRRARITAAQTLVDSSPVNNINGAQVWLESATKKSFSKDQMVDGIALAGWSNILSSNPDNVGAVQTNSANQPTYTDNGAPINSIPAVKFDGTNSYMTMDGRFLNNSDYTIFVVEQRGSNKSGNYFIGDSASTPNNQSILLGYSADNQIIHEQGLSNQYASNIAPFATNDSPKIFTFVQDSNSGKSTYINGFQTGTSNDATQLQGITNIDIGKNYNGSLGEVIMFDRALTTNEIQEIQSYLADKWVITTPLDGGGSTNCTSGTVIGNVCDSSTCNVAITGITTTSVTSGSGSLSCNTGYSGGPVTYTCLNSVFNSSGTCTAITCTITGVTGLTNQSGLAYAASPQSLSCNTGYSGSPTYTCTSSGAASISGSCSAITCSITSVTGLPNQSGLAYASSATAVPGGCSSGYSGSPTYTCTSSGAATIVSGCTLSNCTVSGVTGITNGTTVSPGTNQTLYCNGNGYNTSDSITYNCSAGSFSTVSGACDTCASNYGWTGSACSRICYYTPGTVTGIGSINPGGNWMYGGSWQNQNCNASPAYSGTVPFLCNDDGTISYGGTCTVNFYWVGTYSINDGPNYVTAPQVQYCTQSCANSFGGSPSNYHCSPSGYGTITNQAWTSVYGTGCVINSEIYSIGTGGKYISTGDTSSYVGNTGCNSSYYNNCWRNY